MPRTEKRAEYERQRQQRRREEGREYVDNLKLSTPCADCGLNYEPWQMDFDHLGDVYKRRDVAVLVNQGRTLNVIKAEIAKCELVCVNCHRTRTRERRMNGSAA